MPIDEITLRFDVANLTLLNAILGLVMFGIALDLRFSDFRAVLESKRAAVLGLSAQFVLLPAVTFLLVRLLEPHPSMALGMFLVAACPGGNLSNFMAHLARGNTALSVSLSAVSTLAATVMTPLNLTVWASLYPPTAEILRRVSLDPLSIFITIAVVLGIPVTLGMTIAHRFPSFAARARRPMKFMSLVVFAGFVVIALWANFDHFLTYIGEVALLVILHNTLALTGGYGAARMAGLPEADRRAVAIEVGIQNSALGLLLIFDFFDGLGGMALVAAWWGIWHIVSGVTVAGFWSRRPIDGGRGGVRE